MTARQVASAQRLAQVQAAAWELFRSQGYQATTVRQIASAAGVSVGTVINTGDKGGLLVHLFEDALAAHLQEQATRSVGREGAGTEKREDLTEAVWSCFQDFFDFYAAAPDLSRAYLRELLTDRPDRRTGAFDLARAFIDQLETLLLTDAPGTAGSGAAHPVAETLFAIYLATLIGWLSGPYPLEAALDGCRRQVDYHVKLYATSRNG